MSLCKKYDCKKCESYKKCGGCEKCNGCPFGSSCVAAELIKEKGYDYYLSIERKIIDEVNNLGIDELYIDSLNILPGAYVNLEYTFSNGSKGKLLKDDSTYFANQVERKNNDRCYGIASDGHFIVVSEYGMNGIDPVLVSYKKIDGNKAKKRIGFIVAIEIDAIKKVYKNVKEINTFNGFKLFEVEEENYICYFLRCGMGECASSAGVEYLISKYNVEMIINFGVVGGLTSEMKKQKVCLVNRVVHYKYDCSEFMDLKVGQVDGHDSIFLKTNEELIENALLIDPTLKLVTCCSGDKFISTASEKEYLHETFEGDICDMESSGIVLTSELHNIPCILFKAVSDGLADGAKGFYDELESASLVCLQVADKIIKKMYE